MNCLLLKPDDFIDAHSVKICDARLNHCLTVLKARPGDTLQVGQINGKLGSATVRTINSSGLVLDKINCDQHPPLPLDLTLVLALPRPKALKRILRNIAECGVKKLILINAYKVEKSYWQSPVIDEAEYYFSQGLEQAKDTIFPKLQIEQRFKPFVEDTLPSLCERHTAFVAHPKQKSHQQHNFANIYDLNVLKQAGVIVIGPEGGFIPYEVEKLIAAGCRPLDLGERIYRVENAISRIVHHCL